MQTFLPSPDFFESAHILDYRRLGKQRVEVYQILNTLDGKSKGWVNHPATLMWKNHRSWLIDYGIICCYEWIDRGFKDNMIQRIMDFSTGVEDPKPLWLGDNVVHASHRSNLLRKDYNFYSQYGWSEPPTLPYVWKV